MLRHRERRNLGGVMHLSDDAADEQPAVTVVYCKWCGWSGRRPRLWTSIREGRCPKCSSPLTPAGRRSSR
jgi:RNase P subunit RPR2